MPIKWQPGLIILPDGTQKRYNVADVIARANQPSKTPRFSTLAEYLRVYGPRWGRIGYTADKKSQD